MFLCIRNIPTVPSSNFRGSDLRLNAQRDKSKAEKPVVEKMSFDKEFAATIWGNIINSSSFRDVTLVAEKDQQKYRFHILSFSFSTNS